MNINIGNPFFLHNEIVLHNSRLAINSKLLSKLLNIPYPKLLKTIRIIISRNEKRKNDFIMVATTYHSGKQNDSRPEYLITPTGIDTLAKGELKSAFNEKNRKRIFRHLKFRSYDQRIQD